MRKKNVLLGFTIGIATALLGATATKFSRNLTEAKAGKHGAEELPPGFVWIEGMDLEKSDEEPFFDEGETVYLVNPHIGGFWAGNSVMSAPVVFEVVDAEYDEEDVEWRYKIYPRDVSESECGLPCDLETEWFAEKWLDIADKPSMRRKDFVRKAEDVVKFSEVIVSHEVDYLLDTLNHSTDDKEREQALARLEELTEGDGE